MDIVFKISAIAVIGVLAATVLRHSVPEMSIAVTLAVQFAMAATAIGVLAIILDFLKELSAMAGISQELLAPLLKTMGVSIVTKIACDTCKDGGAAALASYIELVGGAVAVSFSIPLMLSVLRLISL